MIQKWRRKALIYKLMAAVPGGEQVFDFARTNFGNLKTFNLKQRKSAIEEMFSLLKQANKTVQGKRLAEIGVGWHPFLAAIFYAAGAKTIMITDIASHLNQEYIEQTINYLITNSSEISNLVDITEEQLIYYWETLNPRRRNWQTVWENQGIIYRAPFDFSNTFWDNESVDMIFSNSCLGYIPETILQRIIIESHRLLSPNGFVAHNITTYDDYCGVDPTISAVNFLFFDQEVWERVGNSRLHYQNRLRPQNYRDMFLSSGLDIKIDSRTFLPLSINDSDRQKLAAKFRDLPDEELLCSHLMLVAEKSQIN